jgi:hypothetical protein
LLNILNDEEFKLLNEMVTLTYGSQEEIDGRTKNQNKLYSVLIIKPIEQPNDSIIEHYSSELKGIGIINSTWDENLWAFRAAVMGSQINKIREKGFMVMLDRRIQIILPP